MKMREFENLKLLAIDLGADVTTTVKPVDGIKITRVYIPGQFYVWEYRIRKSVISGPKKVRRDGA